MTDPNLTLYAATYDDATSAGEDYQALKALEADDFKLAGAVVMHRDADGEVKVDASGTGAAAGGAILGGAAGLVVGLFAPPLLLATAVGAGLGAVGGELLKKHSEKQLGLDMEQTMPPGTSAIIAIIDDEYADRIDAAFAKATKRVSKAIDSGDYEKLAKALDKGDQDIVDALES